MGDRRWTAPTDRFGLSVAVGDAVSKAFQARSGDNIEVRVEADRSQIRDYVLALDERFGKPAKDAELVGILRGRPAISKSSWGRVVRRATMRRAIARTLERRIRPRLPLVMKPLRPTISRAKFGPVIIIHRAGNRLELFNGTRRVRTFRVATGQAAIPDADRALRTSSTCSGIPGGVRRTPTGPRG